MTVMIPATGMASSAPRRPPSSTPIRALTSTVKGFRRTVRDCTAGCEDVVLDLLVDDEEDDRDDAGRRGVQERDQHHDHRSEQGSDERDQVRQPDPEGQHTGERRPGGEHHDEARAPAMTEMNTFPVT